LVNSIDSPDSLPAAQWIKLNSTMSKNTHLTTWLSSESKEQFAALARAQGLSESACLKRLVEAALVIAYGKRPELPETAESFASSGRISVRLRSDDLLLLRERSNARRMPTSTYVSLLVRAHLRALTPLPTAELAALKRAVAEIGAIGRNLNQIARAVNQGQWPNGPTKADLQAMLRALVGLRDRVKDLINVNLASWDAGYEKANR
jgi:Bacterial mobilisation protein (MobC)